MFPALLSFGREMYFGFVPMTPLLRKKGGVVGKLSQEAMEMAKKRRGPTRTCVCGAVLHARKSICPKCGAKKGDKKPPRKKATRKATVARRKKATPTPERVLEGYARAVTIHGWDAVDANLQNWQAGDDLRALGVPVEELQEKRLTLKAVQKGLNQ